MYFKGAHKVSEDFLKDDLGESEIKVAVEKLYDFIIKKNVTTFHSSLYHAIIRAGAPSTRKLASVFPAEYVAYCRWFLANDTELFFKEYGCD